MKKRFNRFSVLLSILVITFPVWMGEGFIHGKSDHSGQSNLSAQAEAAVQDASSLSDFLKNLNAKDPLKPQKQEGPKPEEPLPATSPAAVEVITVQKKDEVETHRKEKERLHQAVTTHPRYGEFKSLMASHERFHEARKEVESACTASDPSCQKDRELLAKWESINEAKRQEMQDVFGGLVEQHHQVSDALSRAQGEHRILKAFQSQILEGVQGRGGECSGSNESVHRCMQSIWEGASATSVDAKRDLDEVAIKAEFEREKSENSQFRGLVCLEPCIGNQSRASLFKEVPAPTPQVGGVAIDYDAITFSQALHSAKKTPSGASGLYDQWAQIHLENIPRETVTNLVGVSLKALTDAASNYTQQWETLPDELRYPGQIVRLRGVVLDPQSNNVILIGQHSDRSNQSDYLSTDDLIVAFQTVIKKNETPAVSIDPNADDSTLPHQSRVTGIPGDSEFAKTLLDADYTMKRIIGESLILPISNLTETIRKENQTFVKLAKSGQGSRFWLYPIQPFAGSMIATSDGTTVVFQNGVQVLTEEIMMTQKGMSGKGRTLEPDRKIAMAFTRYYPKIAQQEPSFQKTEGLFDLVFVAHLLKNQHERFPWLASLNTLPYRRTTVPQSFAPVVKDYLVNHGVFRLSGGVHIPYESNVSALQQINEPSLLRIRKEAVSLSKSGKIAQPLTDTSLQLATIDYTQWEQDETNLLHITQSLTQGDYASAHQLIDMLLKENSFNPSLHLLKAAAFWGQLKFDEAEKSAQWARVLAAGDRMVVGNATIILASKYSAQGQHDRALKEIEFALRSIADDPWLYMCRAEILWDLNRQAEGRESFRKATSLDPAFAMAYASQARLEAAEGFAFRAKKLAKKAYTLDPGNPDIQADLALADVTLRQVDEGEALARDVLQNPGAMPATRYKGHFAMALAAGIRGNWQEMEAEVEKAIKIFPNNQALLQSVGELAQALGNSELGQKYLDQANRLHP